MRSLKAGLAGTLLVLAQGCATLEREGVVASAGGSISQHSARTPLGELEIAGVLAETRVALPAGFYGMLQMRSERGEGRQGAPSGGLSGGLITDNDYLRTTYELGWDFGLPLGFIGGVGVNLVQADLDVGITVDTTELKVAVNREEVGGRLRLARRGEWLSLAGEVEISPVEEAVAGIYELESGRRFGRNWSLALRYGQFPEITQAAVLLRYRYGGGDRPLIADKPLPESPQAPARLILDPLMDGQPDRGVIAAPPPAPPRPDWLDETKPPEVEWTPKARPDGSPEWADDPPATE